MQIKNRKKKFIIFFIIFNMLNFSVNAEEFNIVAKEVLIDKENGILVGDGSVKVEDTEGKIIFADKVTYTKSKEFLLAEGNVKIVDNEGNILKTDKATYDKINEKIVLYDNTEFYTIATVEPELKNRTITMNGVSKAYCMTGWRLGYCGGPKEIIAGINKIQSQIIFSKLS